jgi:hypothetical protein
MFAPIRPTPTNPIFVDFMGQNNLEIRFFEDIASSSLSEEAEFGA